MSALDLNSVALLIKIVEHKSFSKASLATGIPTSSISRKISELEAHLKIRLLERTTRKLRLTVQGREFYERSVPAISALHSAKQYLVDKKEEVSGILRLSIPPGLEENLIIPCLAKFQKEYPDISLKVIATSNHLKFIEDGIDVALRIGELKDSNLIARTLIEYDHILVASPSYIKEHGMPKTPALLLQHQLICTTNWHNDRRWSFYKGSKKFVLEVEEVLSINNYAAMKNAIEKGMGLGELPSVNCKEALLKNELIRVLPDWDLDVYGQTKLKLSIVFTANRYNSILINSFKVFCIKYFKSISNSA